MTGIREGCILSSVLFSLYKEELAVRLRRKNAGGKVGEDWIGILLYADDVLVKSESVEELPRVIRCGE